MTENERLRAIFPNEWHRLTWRFGQMTAYLRGVGAAAETSSEAFRRLGDVIPREDAP